MNEVEKEVREILKKEFCSNACELYSKCVEECLDQATTEIMDIMKKEAKRLWKIELRFRYYALKSMNLINILRAYDPSGIPSSDAQDAFNLLGEITKSGLTEREQSFGSNHTKEIKELEQALKGT